MSGRTLGGAWWVLVFAAGVASAQPLEDRYEFKELIERGEYEALGRKLRRYLDVERADPSLRFYLEENLRYLERGARPRAGGEEVVLFRGAKNDSAYPMPESSRGSALMLPNTIRYNRSPNWDRRLRRIGRYFTEATTHSGGNGEVLHELGRIMEHHKGGGLGTNANSTRSVLISTSTRPIQHFGPPYYIMKVPAERAIFNYHSLSGEYEVLLPFWVLPHEIVAKVNTWEELQRHPLYQESRLKDLKVREYSYSGGGNSENWRIIEENIRAGRAPLEGLAGLNSYFPGEGTAVGPEARPGDVERFIERVERRGGVVEFVPRGDLRLPEGAQARTYLDAEGRPHVLLRQGQPVQKFALLDELTHVHQLARMIEAQGARAVQRLLLRARAGDPQALDVVNRWEIRAKRLIRSMLAEGDPARAQLDRSIEALERELDPFRAQRRGDGTINWGQLSRQFAGSLVHFSLSLFLKELAVVAQTGDRARIEEFFDGLMGTDFYVHFGLFSLGAASADMAYARFLERHVARYVRPQFVRTVLRSNLSLAVGMALPDLLTGHFEGRTFALNLAGLGLSSTAVRAGVSGLRWVSRLRGVPGGAGLAARLGRSARLASVAGFTYHVLETAVVLYFGEMITRELDARLARRGAEQEVRAATEALVEALRTGGDAREAADALAVAHRAYRDVLTRPLQELDQRLWQRLDRLGVGVFRDDTAREAAEERVGEDREHLRESMERLDARREAEREREAAEAFDSYEAAWSARAEDVYGESGGGVRLGDAASWVLGGGDDPYGGRGDWLASVGRDWTRDRVLDRAADLPTTRLAAYEHEASFYEALAAAWTHDPGVADEFVRRAELTREVARADAEVALGRGVEAEPEEEGEDDPLIRGFVEALEEAGQ